MLGVKRGNVFADYSALQKKHPDQFGTSREVKQHVDWVFEKPTKAFPGNQFDHRLLVRDDEKAGKAVAVEVEMRGGKYRVRSAYTLTQKQREVRGLENSAGRDAVSGALACKSGEPKTPSRLLGMLCNMLPADVVIDYGLNITTD